MPIPISPTFDSNNGYGNQLDVNKAINAKFKEPVQKEYDNLGLTLTDNETEYIGSAYAIAYNSTAVSIEIDSIEYSLGVPTDLDDLVLKLNDVLDIGIFYLDAYDDIIARGFHDFGDILQDGHAIFEPDIITPLTNKATQSDINRELALRLEAAGGGSGTVTSITYSLSGTSLQSIFDVNSAETATITTSGTFTMTLNTQTANTVFAGPVTGAAAIPTFRALVAADIPTLSSLYWTLDGNTVGSIKWIGTVDGYDFPIRTNNTEKARVFTTGEVGIGITASALGTLHVKGLSGQSPLYVINNAGTSSFEYRDEGHIYRNGIFYSVNGTAVNQNTTWGYNAGSGLTSGGANTLIGYTVGQGITVGAGITMVGAHPSSVTDIGTGVSAFGYGALQNSTGGYNTALGREAGRSNTSGVQNMYLGSYADVNDSSTALSNLTGAYNIIMGCIIGTSSSAFTGGNAFNSVWAVHGIGTASNQIVFGGGSSSTYFTDFYIGKGVTNTSPTAITIHATSGSGTDIAGANLQYAIGQATGNAASGDHLWYYAPSGSTGTTLTTLTEAMRLKGTTGNLGIGVSPNAAYRLHSKGSGTTSATLNFYTQNSDNSKSFAHYDNGVITRDGDVYSISSSTTTSWGYSAGEAANALNTGSVFIGYFAGTACTTNGVVVISGDSNNVTSANYGTGTVAIGNGAVISATGSYNVAYGFNAGSRTTTGLSNVYIGSYADRNDSSSTASNITGNYNIVIGSLNQGASAGTSFVGGNALSSNFVVHGIGTASNQIVFGGGIADTYFTSFNIGYSTGGAKHSEYYRTSTPESAQTGNPGDIAYVNDATNGFVYVKYSGVGTNTGWVALTTSGGSVTSVSGTANRITSTGGTTPVIDIASTYVGQNSITTLGTVTTGTLSTGAIIAGVTMTLGSDGTGDIYYRNAGGVLTRLAAGANGTYLTVATGLPSWVAPSSSGFLLASGATTGATSQAQVFTNGIKAGVIDDNATGEIAFTISTVQKAAINTTGIGLIDGSAANPSYYFSSDSSTGFYLKAGNLELGASVNGVLVGGFNTTGLFAGLAGTLSGTLKLSGSTSGTVTIQTAVAAGTWTLTLPTTDGNANEFLQTNGSGVTTWAAAANAALSNLAAVAINTTLLPGSNDGAALGSGTLSFSDLFLASGGLINFANSDWIATHSTGILTVGTGDLRVTTAGTNTASVVTVGGTQTLTGKSIVATQLTGTAYTFAANNTSGTAAYTLNHYENHDLADYGGTFTWNSTPPATIVSQKYAWMRIGNTVTLTISVLYTSTGTTNTTCIITMPSDCPDPAVIANSGDAASEYMYPINGARVEANQTANPSAIRGGIRRNSGNTAFEILVIFGSTSALQLTVTVIYRTA